MRVVEYDREHTAHQQQPFVYMDLTPTRVQCLCRLHSFLSWEIALYYNLGAYGLQLPMEIIEWFHMLISP